jgi:hypothetical protein
MANFTMTRGDTVILSGTTTLGGDPYDLTGATLVFTAKSRYTDADEDAIFQKTEGDGITVVSAAQGLFTVEIEPDDTADVPKVKTVLFWDTQVTDSESKKYTIASGKLIINPDVTD